MGYSVPNCPGLVRGNIERNDMAEPSWSKVEKELIAKANESATARWSRMQNDPTLVIADKQAKLFKPRKDLPADATQYANLRIGRSDYAWVRTGQADTLAKLNAGDPIRPGETPKSERPRAIESFLSTKVNKKTAFDVAQSQGWTLVAFPQFRGTQSILKLRNENPNDVRLTTCFVSSHWDLGPFGGPVPAPGVPLTSAETATGHGNGVTVFVADSGLLSQFFDDSTPPIMALSSADLRSVPVTPADWHGGFVARIINHLAPDATIRVGDVMGPSRTTVWEVETMADLADDANRTFLEGPGANGNAKHIINCSFGGIEDAGIGGQDLAVFDAWLRQILVPNNTVMVAAAGNQGLKHPDWRPGGMAHARLVSVGAVVDDHANPIKVAKFSNFGQPQR